MKNGAWKTIVADLQGQPSSLWDPRLPKCLDADVEGTRRRSICWRLVYEPPSFFTHDGSMYFGIFTYIWVQFSSLQQGQKSWGSHSCFFANPREKIHIYIYIYIQHTYIYIIHRSAGHPQSPQSRTKKCQSSSGLTPGDHRGPRLSHHENNYIQTLYIIFPNLWGVENSKKNDGIGGIGTYLMGPADQFNNKTAGLGFFNHFVLWLLTQNWFEDLFVFTTLRPVHRFLLRCIWVGS